MDRHRKPELFFRLENEALAEKWLNNYIRFGISLVFLICLVEVVCYFILNRVGALDGGAMNYMVMNVVLPCGLSGLGIGMAALIRRGTKNLWGKACAVSLLYVFLAFVIYTVHYRYPSLSASFAMAIFMTLIYGDWKLTTVTAAAALGAKCISDVFLVWDANAGARLQGLEDWLDFGISLLVLLAVYAVCLVILQIEGEKRISSTQSQLEKARLYEEAMTDVLTGIRNRNALRLAFDKMMADTSGAPYVLVILDMDCFKDINDTYGHTVGDQYIQQLGYVLDSVPEADAFRFGGDEFCMLFRGSTRRQIEQCCQWIQETFLDCKICRSRKPVTISFGAAQYQKDIRPSELVRRADEALYRAKRMRGTLQFFGEMRVGHAI